MLRSTPVFGDPKTDFVFQRIFGSEDHKTALIGFLDDILQIDDAHRITQVALLPPEQSSERSPPPMCSPDAAHGGPAPLTAHRSRSAPMC